MRILMAGYGTVGKGFADVLEARRDLLIERYGEENLPRIVCVMDSRTVVRDPAGIDMKALEKRKDEKGTVGDETYTDSLAVIDSVGFDLLVEVSPTNIEDGGAGLRNIRRALERGKDVITVNKGPLALCFKELLDLAVQNECKLKFEGSVGGAMPIINLCHSNLRGEKIRSIRGILNGTCNYILTKMDNGQPFEQALKEAQQRGYAETDPTNDIEGFDAAAKVTILANSVFHRDVTIRDVKITGISSITPDAIALAASRNMVIRLIGEVSDTKLEVSPRLIPKGHPLAISGTLNKAMIDADLAGPITVSGRGAGRIETASAILGDLLSVMDSRIGKKHTSK